MKILIIIMLVTTFVGYAQPSDKVSLSFDNSDIHLVLKALAKLKQVNLLVTDKVVGTVSIEFENVPWRQALDLLTKMHGWEFQLQDNVLLVAPLGDLTKQALEKLELTNKLASSQPLLTHLLPIRFAKAKDLVATLNSSKGAILSTRGKVMADERTNTLIVKDTELALSQIIPAIERLDKKTKQVIIEARIVTIRDNLDEQLGIQWGVSGSSRARNNIISGSLSGIEQIRNDGLSQTSYLDRLNVSLPTANPAGRVAVQVAKLADGLLLDLELSALERESKGEVIASPRILATNQNTSRIEQGTEIPYLQAAAHGATSVAFKKAVLSLEVTPQITPKGEVILDLVITQDARGDTIVTSTGPAVAIDTQQIATRVTAKNGETIVLGGIYQQQVVNSSNRVPILSELPYLGQLFKSETSYNEKRQLLVFVTPKLIEE